MSILTKKSISFLLSIFLLFSVISLSSCRSKDPATTTTTEAKDFFSAPPNAVVFSIRDIEVTKAEIMEDVERIKPITFDRDTAQMSPEESQSILDQFIIQAYKTAKANTLFQIYAQENGITVTEEEVQATANKFKNMIENSQEGFTIKLEDVLKEHNLTYDDFLNDMRKQALQDKVMQPEYENIEVTEDELLNFYEKNYNRYNREESAHLHIINLQSRMEADQVLNEILGGADFHDVAKKYTSPEDLESIQASPGDVGPIPRSGMPPAIQNEIFQSSRPLMTPFIASLEEGGEIFFIIRVVELFDEENHALEVIIDTIMNDILEEKKFHETEVFLKKLEKIYTVKEHIPPPASPTDMMQQMPPMP